MSRPPIVRKTPSPRGINNDQNQTTYFGLRFADLVALAEDLAQDPAGVKVPGSSHRLAAGIVELPGKDRGLARTLIEIPAILAHILGEHQSHYAAEAFVGTATQPNSLIRHARKLAYVPDQGVAATGLAVFDVKEGLAGDVPALFALQSEPKGAIKSQTYETLKDIHVQAQWNAILPAAARVPTPVTFIDNLVTLPLLTPSGLDIGDIVLLQGQGKSAVCEVSGDAPGLLELRRLSQGAESADPWPAFSPSDPYVVLAQPDLETRMFGHSADPLAFPPAELSDPGSYFAPTTVSTITHGYTVSGISSGSYSAGSSLLLAETTPPIAAGAEIALVRASSATPLRVAQAREAAVSFRRGELIAIPQPSPAPTGFPQNQLAERSISVRSTLLDVTNVDGTAQDWPALPLDGVIYAGWARRIVIAPSQANPANLTATVALAADLSDMPPGRAVIVERLSDSFAASATITRIEPLGTNWEVTLSFDAEVTASSFVLGDVHIRANAARVSHGESKSEVLGASDGVTPHQSFTLKSADVTRIASAEGSTLALSLRVNGVLWDPVTDFHASAPEDRLYRTEADADGHVSAHFGGENRGAVPPSGTRNITADYRVGLGRIGDAEAGRLTRIKKASPILQAVSNPLPLAGGTDRAAVDDMRRQATKPILTFDRAVSLQDYADLALLFPGIARAAARWLDRGAIELIAASADGAPPADPTALRAFLDARRDTEIPLVLLTPQAIDIALNLRIERNRTWLADAVRLDATAALLDSETQNPGMFTFAGRAFSAPQSLSGLYARLLDLDGVTGVEANRFAILPDIGVADILHATDRQWLRLTPSNLVIDVVEPGALIPEFQVGV
ncbi:putative baseplate assembly protein [Shimia sp. NS0008-38b]|uniref:hypothetical protein n=1 Tax=Shimia sp. NS0008-38b TaxID=3127653 RepID=UPI003106C144